MKLIPCPICGESREPLPSGLFARCPGCGAEGCDDCVPGGVGCYCVECDRANHEEDAARDAARASSWFPDTTVRNTMRWR